MSAAPPPQPPPLPPEVSADSLRELDGDQLLALAEGLRTAERATLGAMAPYDAQLREVRGRLALIATEQRRRERAERHAARLAVRDQARTGELPNLAEALDAGLVGLEDERPLADLRAYLATGGEVRFGYPTRPGSISFTDGRGVVSAATWGEARQRHLEGLEPGTPALPGVRVHLAGTRIEKVLAASEVLVSAERVPAGG